MIKVIFHKKFYLNKKQIEKFIRWEDMVVRKNYYLTKNIISNQKKN
jgi:hypothetical protein